MFWQMLSIERTKISRRTMFWVELGLMALTVLALVGLFFGVRQALNAGVTEGSNWRIEGINGAEAESMLTWPGGILMGFTAVYGVGAFLVIVLAGAVTAQEYGWRSFQLWLSRGVPRPLVLLAKFTAVCLTTLLLVIVAVSLGALLTAGFSQAFLDAIPLAEVRWGQVLLNSLLLALGLLPYAALTLLLAVASRSTVVAIGGGLAFTTLLEPILSQLAMLLGGRWAELVQYLPRALNGSLRSLTAEIAPANPFLAANTPPMGVSTETAVIGLALYTIFFVGMALVIFQRQDLGG